MGQVLTLLGLAVADPLRSAVAVLNIDVPALFIHFECHGIKHSYYAGWLVAASFPPQFPCATQVAWLQASIVLAPRREGTVNPDNANESTHRSKWVTAL